MAKKAFLVGVNTLGLCYASNDVILLSDALQKHEYKITTPSTNKEDILSKFDSFIDDCSKSDTIVFYFSGHGHTPRGKLQLVLGAELTKSSNQIPMDYFTGLIENSKAENKLIILDCCKANSITNDWNPNQSDRYKILTSSEKLENGKEINKFKASFLSFFIHKGLKDSETEFEGLDNISINALYEWLCKKAEEYNAENATQKVPLPNLLWNQKINFNIANNQQISKNQFKTNLKAEKPVLNTKRYLRKRCRYFPNGSKDFNSVISNILSVNFDNSLIDEYKSKINSLEKDFERQMSMAVFHEKVAKIETVLSILDGCKFSGIEESSRLLYHALALEKLDRIDEAMEDLHEILGNEEQNSIVKAAQFNRMICLEKINRFDKVNFTSFFKNKEFVYAGNERLKDKAIIMHFIFCDKSGIEFMFDDLLEETLEYEKNNNPVDYFKSVLNIATIKGDKQLSHHIDDIIKIRHKLSINNRAGIQCKIAQLINIQEHPEVFNNIVVDLDWIYKKYKSESIKKFIDDLMSYHQIDDFQYNEIILNNGK